MVRQTRRLVELHMGKTPFTSQETEAIVGRLKCRTTDEQLASSVEFSPTAISMIRRVLIGEGLIVTDTETLAASVRAMLPTGCRANVCCYLEDSAVGRMAEMRRVTRAEVATDLALSQTGPKVMIIGTAPAALSRVLYHRQKLPMTDVIVVTTVSGFAQAVELKERLRDSGLAYVVTRGRCGGPVAAEALMNSIFEIITKK